MNYNDPVYGAVEITAPVLLDLMQGTAMQRLQLVMQHGISGLLGLTRATTRFEHSLGVMLLVRRLQAPIEEQIAALLHDVSHTAFSHVIDYVFGSHDSQSYHDEMKEVYLAGTDIPAVLAQHGYDWRDYLDEARYPLLEQAAPALCADRLDYFLRDSLDLGLATPDDVRFALAHLVVHNSSIVTDNVQAARWMAYTYIKADDCSWANFREVGLYELAARAIKTGLSIGAITQEDDIWSTDVIVWDKLHTFDDPALQAQLKLVSLDTRFVWDEVAPTFWVSTKLRTIDPDVLHAGELRRLSVIDPEFAAHRIDYLARKQGKWPVRVVT